MSINKVIIIGRIGSSVELKYTQSGLAVCNFTLATSESWNDKQTGKKMEKTEWSKVVIWGKLAELCNQHLKKGSQCYVEGKLATRSYDDKEGYKRYVTEIVASEVQFLDSKGDASTDNKPQQQQQYKVEVVEEFSNEDLPF